MNRIAQLLFLLTIIPRALPAISRTDRDLGHLPRNLPTVHLRQLRESGTLALVHRDPREITPVPDLPAVEAAVDAIGATGANSNSERRVLIENSFTARTVGLFDRLAENYLSGVSIEVAE